jgi:hypothetical protein
VTVASQCLLGTIYSAPFCLSASVLAAYTVADSLVSLPLCKITTNRLDGVLHGFEDRGNGNQFVVL